MTMDKLSFKRFRTLLVVCSITFPILFTFTLMHQNSIYDLVEGVSKINILAGRAQNATTDVLKEGTQNVTVQAGVGKDQNVTGSVVGKAIVCNLFLC